ncbi:hypothetical protein JG688_00011812 [Phytophthora aleatoria]|uniref:RxLR effector protein n=1 Tax=Phytophthora aleatoria TaxID=2496075 RepID=A0A8J5MEY8_9STRA|nr:hypothetical protein JG688_00011812 [Phytophthora aleatoria]
MRLSSMLSVMTATIYFVACNAAADFDQPTAIESPALVRPLNAAQNVDATGRRFLRHRRRSQQRPREILQDSTKANAA